MWPMSSPRRDIEGAGYGGNFGPRVGNRYCRANEPASGVELRCAASTVDDERQAHFFNHLVYQATAATILSGAIAERVSLAGYVVLSIFVSGLVFSLAVRFSWAGGFLDHQSITDPDLAS